MLTTLSVNQGPKGSSITCVIPVSMWGIAKTTLSDKVIGSKCKSIWSFQPLFRSKGGKIPIYHDLVIWFKRRKREACHAFCKKIFNKTQISKKATVFPHSFFTSWGIPIKSKGSYDSQLVSELLWGMTIIFLKTYQVSFLSGAYQLIQQISFQYPT